MTSRQIFFCFFVALFLAITIYAMSKMNSGNSVADVAKKLHSKWSGLKETDPEYHKFLLEQWKNVGLSDEKAEEYIRARNAWSAAFVSLAMTKAGYSDFPKSAQHSCYNEKARNNRNANTGKFRLYRISEYRPQVGDIVSKNRSGGSITFDNVQCGQASHSDIVIEVRPNELITIGGNVSDTVSITRVPTKDGFINHSAYYGVIKNLHENR